jgi:UDP-glucose 4-epimerase
MTRAFVAGGAGFIGSHLVHELLGLPDQQVVVFDNLSSGDKDHLSDLLEDERLTLVVGELQSIDDVTAAMNGCDHVYHFAANPDISRAVSEPTIDFWQGTYLTNNIIDAMRVNRVPRITYASGSGVYGDRHDEEVDESFGPLIPVSTYGASKLACEALLASYVHMFGIHAVAFRFANVVGSGQTHGVTYDFVRHLREDPAHLRILGDGSQSKSYIHVDDVVAAMLLLSESGWSGFEVFNAGTGDYVTVTEIADLVVERMGLDNVDYQYTGGDRGWKGDVPIVRFRSDKLEERGWRHSRGSREALIDSIDSNIREAERELGRDEQ